MKNIKIQLVLFSFLISITSIAQVPGYLGKRFSVGYSNYFFPRFPSLSSAISLGGEIRPSTEHLFNSTHCLDMDYILGQRVSFCLSGQFSKMDLIEQRSVFSVDKKVQYIPASKKDMGLNTINFSVGVLSRLLTLSESNVYFLINWCWIGGSELESITVISFQI